MMHLSLNLSNKKNPDQKLFRNEIDSFGHKDHTMFFSYNFVFFERLMNSFKLCKKKLPCSNLQLTSK